MMKNLFCAAILGALVNGQASLSGPSYDSSSYSTRSYTSGGVNFSSNGVPQTTTYYSRASPTPVITPAGYNTALSNPTYSAYNQQESVLNSQPSSAINGEWTGSVATGTLNSGVVGGISSGGSHIVGSSQLIVLEERLYAAKTAAREAHHQVKLAELQVKLLQKALKELEQEEVAIDEVIEDVVEAEEPVAEPALEEPEPSEENEEAADDEEDEAEKNAEDDKEETDTGDEEDDEGDEEDDEGDEEEEDQGDEEDDEGEDEDEEEESEDQEETTTPEAE